MLLVESDSASKASRQPLEMPIPSTSTEPPPPFSDIDTENNHLLIDLSQPLEPGLYPDNTEEPPPEFTPYDAEHFDVGNGNIISHDPHLNTDGEALYRFLLSQAQTPPKLALHVRGSHSETHHRDVTVRRDGKSHTERQSYTTTVVDFDFTIDCDKYVLPNVVHWSVGDTDPAYRGRMVKDLSITGGPMRKAKRKENKQYSNYRKQLEASGLPPWLANIDGRPTQDGLKSSKSMREWADDYCASPKHLKEFVYVKSIYGWRFDNLEIAVRKAIMSATLYSGNLIVSFDKSATKVYIRPDNRLSRMLSNKWIKFFSIILFIFPFIWLYKRFHRKGGGRWEVCGGAYPTNKWVALDGPDQKDGKTGLLLGCREVDWLKEWEGTILEAVRKRHESYVPIDTPTHLASRAAQDLLVHLA